LPPIILLQCGHSNFSFGTSFNFNRIFSRTSGRFDGLSSPNICIGFSSLNLLSFSRTSGLLLNKAIEKYGRENFLKEVVEQCNSKEELNIDPMVFPTGFALSYNACGPSFVSE